jgi:predicted RNase H-like nuclease (RuvC/YqgF family)
MTYKEAVLEKEVQKLKEENSSLKSLLEALNTKVAQMQIELNIISEKVGVNTSYVLANQLIDSWLLKGEEK